MISSNFSSYLIYFYYALFSEELLSNEENIQNSESLLWYHRELIDLLSFCATNNHEVRILCSTILSLSEILEFLNLLIKVNIRLSIPYLNLITQVKKIKLENTKDYKYLGISSLF